MARASPVTLDSATHPSDSDGPIAPDADASPPAYPKSNASAAGWAAQMGIDADKVSVDVV